MGLGLASTGWLYRFLCTAGFESTRDQSDRLELAQTCTFRRAGQLQANAERREILERHEVVCLLRGAQHPHTNGARFVSCRGHGPIDALAVRQIHRLATLPSVECARRAHLAMDA